MGDGEILRRRSTEDGQVGTLPYRPPGSDLYLSPPHEGGDPVVAARSAFSASPHLQQGNGRRELTPMALERWGFDLAHSSVSFWVRHLMVSKVHGRFTTWKGSL